MAAYTTYKVTMTSVNLKRKRLSSNCLIKLLRTINFIDALISVLILQSTLITVSADSSDETIFPMITLTSGGIWLAIVFVSIYTAWGSFTKTSEK